MSNPQVRTDLLSIINLPSPPHNPFIKKTPTVNPCNWTSYRLMPSEPRLSLRSSRNSPTKNEHTFGPSMPVSNVANKDIWHANAPPRPVKGISNNHLPEPRFGFDKSLETLTRV